jgi:hypothetical protein
MRLQSPLARWWGLSLLLAVLTAIVWPTIPSYDPFSWVVWGREVTDPQIGFFVGGGPSWKPLPFLFTTVYGPFAGAPALWVITARIGGIAGLIGGYRVAFTLTARAGLPRWAAVAGGLFAAIGVGLTIDWSYYFFRGSSEPILIAVALWAVDRLLAGRHWPAFLLVAVEGLMRPEAWPFLLLYAIWMWRHEPALRTRALVLLALLAQPAAWFVPPWISTGQPFLAASHASSYNGHLGSNPFLTVIGRGRELQPLPMLVLGVVAVLIALWCSRQALGAMWSARRPDWAGVPPELVLGAIVVAWWVVVVGMTLDGYPGLERFFLPAAALTCALSGVGLVRVGWALAGAFAAHRGRAPAWRAPIAAGVAVVLAAVSVHWLSPRIDFARAQEPLAATAVTRIDQLGQAVKALGGRSGVLPCGSSVVTINHSLQTALAWKLETSLERVKTALHAGEPGLAFVGPHDSIDGGYPPVSGVLSVHRVVARVGVWRIVQVYPPGPKPRCVGG